jgi:hypothetical protein
MAVTVKYSNGIVIHYKNIPEPTKLQFRGSSTTLFSVPVGYQFDKESLPSEATITLEENEPISLSI